MKESIYEKMVRRVFKEEEKTKYSHLIIAIDNSDNEYIKTFVKREDDIAKVLAKLVYNPQIRIHEIYNYDMPLEKQIKSKRAYNIKAEYNKMEEAYDYAKEIHKNQLREDGSLYIKHPVRVAETIKKYFYNHPRVNEFITAAYLHDTVEDAENPEIVKNEIKAKFGEYVSYLVLGVTTDKEVKNKIGKTNYLCYKMCAMDEDVLNLKLCDRLDNISDLKSVNDEFLDKYIIETTIILDYLTNNRILSSVQRKIIQVINETIMELKRSKTLTIVNQVTK